MNDDAQVLADKVTPNPVTRNALTRMDQAQAQAQREMSMADNCRDFGPVSDVGAGQFAEFTDLAGTRVLVLEPPSAAPQPSVVLVAGSNIVTGHPGAKVYLCREMAAHLREVLRVFLDHTAGIGDDDTECFRAAPYGPCDCGCDPEGSSGIPL